MTDYYLTERNPDGTVVDARCLIDGAMNHISDCRCGLSPHLCTTCRKWIMVYQYSCKCKPPIVWTSGHDV